ncbi:ABC transporter permease [Pseudaminobacter sp. NGMCC 1.201702]|uniref:ABC transporter permease n=1 Tax=Pseudaminobacter sp. NGMCC 1.201702 TaxID=3391825 RepID=UPI0039EE57D8
MDLPESPAFRRTLGLGPAIIVITLFMVMPVLIMALYSFLEANPFGGVHWHFTTEAYFQFLFERDLLDNVVFNPSYLTIIARSLVLAAVTTILCLIVGFPVAYFIVRRPPSQRNLWIYLITIPFWTNQLVRTFAWIIILGRNGTIELPFRWLGILGTDETFGLMYTDFAIAVGLTYAFVPIMVLPIYASLEKLDFRLVEASADLYSNTYDTFRRVIIPLTRPGIVAGSILVFIPSLGAFIQPDLLGGGKKLMLGSLVQFQFATARNWPFGAAVAMILLGFVILCLIWYAQAARRVGLQGGVGVHA